MARGGGKRTTGYTEAGRADRLYGTKEEVASRLEDEYPATESQFAQIRPRGDLSPKGRDFDAKNHGQGAEGPVTRGGTFGKDIHRGNP